MTKQRLRQSGFTLIELLVALVIFALISSAGVLLLSSSVSAQGAVKGRLDDLAGVQRASSAMAADLAQALPRISRTETGALAPAMSGRPSSDNAPIIQFVRAGWTNLDDAPRPTLQKVEYWFTANRLERRAYAHIDGGTAGDPAVMLDKVDTLTLRYRDAGGEWLSTWAPEQPDLLPSAIEMQLTRTGHPPVRLLFLVGPGPDEQLVPNA